MLHLCSATIWLVILAPWVVADDWTGKTIQPKQAVKLGRKFGGGLIRDGAAVDPQKTYIVKSDDGSILELDGGHIFKSEAKLVADAKPLPKERAKETDPVAAKGPWFGKKVLPKRDPDTIRMGDIIDGKPEYWTPHNLMNCTVREDRDGWLRLYDMRREGWVAKEDMVTAEDAPAWWDKAVKERPSDYYGWHMRGVGWKDKGEYDNAIKDFTEALRLKPDSAAVYNWRGLAWDSKKEYDKAIADYTEAIRLDPKDALAFNNRGNAWSSKKEYDKAFADYTEAIRLDPKFSFPFYNRGNAWSYKKEYDKAIADYSEAARLDPKYTLALNGLGWAYFQKNEFHKSLEYIERCLQLDPKDSYASGYRARILAAQKKYPEAVAAFEAAVKLPEYAPYKYAEFLASCPEGKYRDGQRALELAKKALEMEGKYASADVYAALAAAYAETGDFERAVVEQRTTIDKLKENKSTTAEELQKAEARLALYRYKKPYRAE
jgi:tetratricopeptide (TPR) repeat protein